MEIKAVDFKSQTASKDFARSIKETGFGVLKNHVIDMTLVHQVFKDWQVFFESDDKFNYVFDPIHQDGYMSIAQSETAKGNDVKDIKEFFQVYPWGKMPPSLKEQTLALWQQMEGMAFTLLTWIQDNTPKAVQEKFSMPLQDMAVNSTRTQLRVLYYPALTGKEQEGAVRAADHTDINLITLLPAATQPGLEVLDSQGNWVPVPCDPGTVVVNAGDMMEMASEHYYPSTRHRVRNPVGEAAYQPRMSLPLFLHARDEVRLSKTHTATDYRMERLRELGLVGS